MTILPNMAAGDNAARIPEPFDPAKGPALLPTCGRWPRGHEQCLPSSLRVPVDADQNGCIDHICTVKVALVDDDGNGRWDRGIDRVSLDPTAVERIAPSGHLTFCATLWRRVVKFAAASL